MSRSTDAELLAMLLEELECGVEDIRITHSLFRSSVKLQDLLCSKRLRSLFLVLDAAGGDVERLGNIRVKKLQIANVAHWSDWVEPLRRLLRKGCVERLELHRCRDLSIDMMNVLSEAVNLQCLSIVQPADKAPGEYVLANVPSSFALPFDIEIDEGIYAGKNTPARPELRAAVVHDCTQLLLAKPRRLRSLCFRTCQVLAAKQFLSEDNELQEVSYFGDFDPVLSLFVPRVSFKEVKFWDKDDSVQLCDFLLQARIEDLMVREFSTTISKTLCAGPRTLKKFMLLRVDVACEDVRNVIAAVRETLTELSLQSVRLTPPESWPLLFSALPDRLKTLDVNVSNSGISLPSTELVKLLARPYLRQLAWITCAFYDKKDYKLIYDAFVKNYSLRDFKGELEFDGDDVDDDDEARLRIHSHAAMLWVSPLLGLNEYWTIDDPEFASVNHRNRCCIGRARMAVIALISLRKFRRSSVSYLLKEIVGIIAKHLWATRLDARSWWDSRNAEGREEIN